MTGLSLLGIAGALIFACAHSIGLGLVGRTLLGMGMACNLMGTLKLMTVWFGSAYPLLPLPVLFFSIGTVGNMAAATPLVLLVNAMGWRQAFMVIAGVNLLLVLILYVVVRDTPPDRSSTSPQEPLPDMRRAFSGLALLLKKKEYWIISLASLVSYGIFGAFQTLWAGPYLMEAMGQSVMNAGYLILIMNLGSISGGPVWGILSDRILRTRKWVVSGGLLILVFIVLFNGRPSRGNRFLVLAFLFFPSDSSGPPGY